MFKVGNRYYFWGAIIILPLIFALSGYDFSLLFKIEFHSAYFFIISAVVIGLVFWGEKHYAFSFWLEKIFTIDKLKTDRNFSIQHIIALLLSVLPFLILFLFIEILKRFENAFSFNLNNITSYLGISATFFITLLGLHWTVVATIFSTKYSNYSKEIQDLYFKHTKTKKITYCTCIYVLFSIIFYYLLSSQWNKKNLIYTINCFSKECSPILNDALWIIIFIWAIASCILLYYYISNSLNFIKLSNSYCLYFFINAEIKYLIQKSAFIQDNSTFKTNFEELIKQISLLQDKIQSDTRNNETTGKAYLEASISYLHLLKIYWKNKNKFFYDSDWFPQVERPNSLAETIYTSYNSVLARNVMYIENSLFELNSLIVYNLIKNNNFSLLQLYYEELRKILSLEERENIISYNVPFFYETLKNIILPEIGLCFQQILNEKFYSENKNNVDFDKLLTTLNHTLGNGIIVAQNFLFQFSEEQINNTFPTYKEIEKTKKIQDMLLQYPILNNEKGLKSYTKLFVEKNTEGKILTPEKQFDLEYKFLLIQEELKNIMDLFQTIDNTFQNLLKFFTEKDNPYFYLNTFYFLILIKYEFVANFYKFHKIYASYFQSTTTLQDIMNKLASLFSLQIVNCNNLTKMIIFYNNNLLQKKYSSLLSNIFNYSLNILIQLFLSNEEMTRKEIKYTMQNIIYVMLISYKIINNEKENTSEKNDNYFSSSYISQFMSFASLIGAALQLSEKNREDFDSVFTEILKNQEIQQYYVELFNIILPKQETQYSIIQNIQQIESIFNVTNSIDTFFDYFQHLLETTVMVHYDK